MQKKPDPVPLPFVLLNEIGIINQLSRTQFEAMLPVGLTASQFSVLNNFVRLGGTRTPAELAEAFQVTRGAMTNTLRRLESKGCISMRAHAQDGRSKEVSITAQGRRLRDKAIVATEPVLAKMQAALSADEMQQLLPLLQKLRIWFDDNR